MTTTPLRGLDDYAQVWCVDFEYTARDGAVPIPICMVARELRSGRVVRLFGDELTERRESPYPTGYDSLFVSYYAGAELSCHRALGWPLPLAILDLYAEFRAGTNGRKLEYGRGLTGAVRWHGLTPLDETHKARMRALAERGGPFTGDERRELMAYCESDADALAVLLPVMAPSIDWPRAVAFRGRYWHAVSAMEARGVPIDLPLWRRIERHWDRLQSRLVRAVDGRGIYVHGRFRAERWLALMTARGVPWPLHPTGSPMLDQDTFRALARFDPVVALYHELRATRSKLKQLGLTVGPDGRNRALLSPWRSTTGRNQPSNSKFAFGACTWVRSLIRPSPGMALAYIDYKQQEFGIAAALSHDEAMMQAYLTGDPYLAFAIQAGAAPEGAARRDHEAVRDRFKDCVLGVQYGMGANTLARRIGQPPTHARELLTLHRQVYHRFWDWSEIVLDHALLLGRLHTPMNWPICYGRDVNLRSVANFPMQATGAEMLRLACIRAEAAGVALVAPVHDALMIEAPAAEIGRAVTVCRDCMASASATVLGGFTLTTDKTIVHAPHRYHDKRGRAFFKTVVGLLPRRPVPA